jgi:hypothetical protein
MEKKVKVPMYAMKHKRDKMKQLAKMQGVSVSALLNECFNFYFEHKKSDFLIWLGQQ